eukprot:2397797-Pleurochrysis_carterae.AAC.3
MGVGTSGAVCLGGGVSVCVWAAVRVGRVMCLGAGVGVVRGGVSSGWCVCVGLSVDVSGGVIVRRSVNSGVCRGIGEGADEGMGV